MRWRWTRAERRRRQRSTESRASGVGRRDSALADPTMQLPLVVESSPLRTPAQRWRGNGAWSHANREVWR